MLEFNLTDYIIQKKEKKCITHKNTQNNPINYRNHMMTTVSSIYIPFRTKQKQENILVAMQTFACAMHLKFNKRCATAWFSIFFAVFVTIYSFYFFMRSSLASCFVIHTVVVSCWSIFFKYFRSNCVFVCVQKPFLHLPYFSASLCCCCYTVLVLAPTICVPVYAMCSCMHE